MGGRYSISRTQTPFDYFFSRNTLTLEVYPVVLNPVAFPTGDPFNAVDVSGLSLVASVLDTSGNTLATQSVWASDAARNTLTGAINCDTVDMAAWVTTDPKRVLIEFRFTGTAGSRNVRADGESTVIRKQFNVTGAPVPVTGAYYPTLDEIKALFVAREMAAGDSVTWKSGDGTKRILEYLDNDGVMRQEAM